MKKWVWLRTSVLFSPGSAGQGSLLNRPKLSITIEFACNYWAYPFHWLPKWYKNAVCLRRDFRPARSMSKVYWSDREHLRNNKMPQFLTMLMDFLKQKLGKDLFAAIAAKLPELLGKK